MSLAMDKFNRIFLLLVAAIPFISNAQNQNTGIEVARMQFQAKQVIPPSPEASELGKYGNVPVSLFTGTPNISIPLVELKGSVLSLPVSLSYNATGFKPEDIAPWTGLGWALNAGGVITRSVTGDPDVTENYFISPSPLDPVPTDELSKQIYFSAIRNKQKEAQPDVYYYNFMGHSGKFLIYPSGEIFKKEKNLLSIVYWPPNPSYGENTFIIIDEQGVQYEFTDMEKTTITPQDDQPNAPPMIIRTFTSAWYLSKVIAPYGAEELIFEYYSPTQTQSTISNSVSNRSISYSITDDGSSFWQFNPPSTNVSVFQAPAVSITKKFIKRVTLKRGGITTSYIDFESGLNERQDLGQASFDGERLLKKIRLFGTQNDVNSPPIKQFDLSYEYFGANQSGTQGYKRLKLKTVQEISPDITTVPSKPPYEFFYKNENDPMPPRFSTGLDHWGFYIGHENFNSNNTAIPTLIPTINIVHPYLGGARGEGADRNANEYGSSLGVIEKITYPTGGYTTFLFELNDANVWNSAIHSDVGGVRISRIIDYSAVDKKAIVKTYEYKKEDGTSSGNSGILPRYDENSDFQSYQNCGNNDKTYTVTISSNSIYGLGSIQGSHIGYERVTEYQTNFDGSQSLGKTIYTYNINGFSEVDDDLGNGDLKMQQVYGTGNKILQETINQYEYEYGPYMIHRKLVSAEHQSSRTALCINGTSFQYYDPTACTNPPPNCTGGLSVPIQYQYYNYNIQWQSKRLKQQVQKVYDQVNDSYVTTTKKFSYANSTHNYPTLIEETTTGGEKIFSSIKYIADYTGSAGGPIAENITTMKMKNMMGIPVEKLQYRQDANGNNTRYISGQLTDYILGNPSQIFFLEAKPLLTSVIPSSTSGSTFSYDDIHYKLAATLTYDNLYNLIEQRKTNDINTTYVWGYNKRFPVAQIIGSDILTVSSLFIQSVLDDPASTELQIRDELNKIRTGLANTAAQVTTYTYKPLIGMSSQTDPNGRTVYYEYDALNRLKRIRDQDGKIVKVFDYKYREIF
jgi:YD repeat-containing protein